MSKKFQHQEHLTNKGSPVPKCRKLKEIVMWGHLSKLTIRQHICQMAKPIKRLHWIRVRFKSMLWSSGLGFPLLCISQSWCWKITILSATKTPLITTYIQIRSQLHCVSSRTTRISTKKWKTASRLNRSSKRTTLGSTQFRSHLKFWPMWGKLLALILMGTRSVGHCLRPVTSPGSTMPIRKPRWRNFTQELCRGNEWRSAWQLRRWSLKRLRTATTMLKPSRWRPRLRSHAQSHSQTLKSRRREMICSSRQVMHTAMLSLRTRGRNASSRLKQRKNHRNAT